MNKNESLYIENCLKGMDEMKLETCLDWNNEISQMTQLHYEF